eukprot:scaffold6162_cov59-Phaeocystis_antarctica.AAC.1
MDGAVAALLQPLVIQSLLRRRAPHGIVLQELVDEVGERGIVAAVVGQNSGNRAHLRTHAAQLSIVLANQELRRPGCRVKVVVSELAVPQHVVGEEPTKRDVGSQQCLRIARCRGA